ncbi:Alpha/beta hydrolase domain containing 18 [Popillia japonica]|uniref:Alpha/beta hydrolase domain containing 18 n=1 Tax=Popillia japonica TaxID=7064 RepID=A0AAW1N0L3_POPJA
MPVSRLDIYYRRLLLSKFFTKGWGDPQKILKLLKFRRIISTRNSCFNLVQNDHHIELTDQQTLGDCHVAHGKFKSPFALHLPDVVPDSVREAYFEIILPKTWNLYPYKPMCIHLAGTGDHYFWKRRYLMAKPLLKHGIGSILLENPFYGYRKPIEQVRSCLFHVSDIFVMGGCLILECIALLHWCERLGYGPLGVTGLSMGGHMASLAATSWPKPLVLVPCLSWSTASSVFTEGVMSAAINWDHLQKQYSNDYRHSEVLSKLCKIVDNPFSCGLAQIPEFSIPAKVLMEKYKNNLCYITPHEILSLTRTHNEFGAEPPKSSQNVVISLALLSRILRTFTTIMSTDLKEIKVKDKEAVWFMRGLMDECTHLKNFDVPVDTSLIIAVCASMDAYVPKEGVSTLEEIWPGASVRHLNCGHVSAYLNYMKLFRSCIVEGFYKAIKKLPPPPSR